MLLVATPTARSARWALIAIAVLMMVTVIFAIVPTPEEGHFGQYAVAAIAAALVIAAIVLPPPARVFCAHFIAAQSCVNALLDIRVLLRPMQAVNGLLTGTSDATAMADNTFATRQPWAVWFWAIVWLVWSLGVLFVALKVSGSREARSAAQADPPTA